MSKRIKWDEWRERVRTGAQHLNQRGQRLRDALKTPGGRALSTFVRPDLGALPHPLRRALEPVLAVLAGVVLGFLAAFGLYHAAIFFACAGLIYAIMTTVFGLELDVTLPR